MNGNFVKKKYNFVKKKIINLVIFYKLGFGAR